MAYEGTSRPEADADRVLLVAASAISTAACAAISEGRAPRVDYLELSRRLGADVVDASVYQRWPWWAWRGLDRRLRLAWGQAWWTTRRWQGYGLVYSFSEDVALALAATFRARHLSPKHIAIVHNVCSPPKRLLVRALGGLAGFHRIVTLSGAEAAAVRRIYGLAPDKLSPLTNHVDDRFWSPGSEMPAPQRLVLSLGRTKRDYRSLLEAAAGLDAAVHVQASSKWRPGGHVGSQPGLPANVVFGGYLDYVPLRELMGRAAVVAVSLRKGAHGSAGTTSVLEAMAMARPVVIATDHAMDEYVVEGETGHLVPAGNAPALRVAINRLLDDPERAAVMGRRGRERVLGHFRLDEVVSKLAALAETVA